MKKIIFFLIISIATISVNAQIANTKWKGSLNIQGGKDVFLNFSADTLEVLNANSNESLETMKYSTKDSLLTLQKLFGSSQCDTDTPGVYKYQINNNELILTLVSDNCTDRAEAIGTMKLEKE